MALEETTYKCVKCKNEFLDIWYTEFDFSERNAQLTCTNCGAKLVADFDFKLASKLSNIYLLLSFVFGATIAITSIIWSYDTVGEYIMYTGLAIGVPLIVMIELLELPDIFPNPKRTREIEQPTNDS
ncbi:MAG: hypothetical protein OQK51_25515 [Kangiellaceae bacterium]|nr:hypothetical protein [Kangiellaceae bacterium]